jgi:predicted nucleic acid-binding protein
MRKAYTPQYAIIDTSVLITLYYLNLLDYLKLFYLEVRVPREVEREFLENPKDELERSKRFDFLLKFYDTNKSWFIPCNEYGSDIISLYLTEKNLDKGEAEVFAQNQALGSIHELLLDENKGRKVAKNEDVKHHGVLYILARLELRFGVCSYFESIKKLQSLNVGRFSKKIIKLVYEQEKKRIYLS